MRRPVTSLPAALCLIAAALAASAQAPAPDPLLQAMRDELDRSRKLTVPNLEAPYFIEYLIEESDNFSVSASLGGLLSRNRNRMRLPEVRVRVGDYKFDNTNYVGAGMQFGTRYDLAGFPRENSYPVLRRYLWLATDSAYKSGVEAISRKRAALRNVQVGDQLNDFAHAAPVQRVEALSRLAVDEEAWAARVRSLSAIFAQHPDILTSSVDFQSGAGGFYLVNSEGTEVRAPESLSYLTARAVAQAGDGMTVRGAATFHSLDVTRMPTDAELQRGVTALAENVSALARAPKGEDYAGPVLFEGMAGPQIFAEVLGRNLALTRRPVMEPGRPGSFAASDLEGRVGSRVLPEWFDVVDDPTQKEWRGRPLFGSYGVDREGAIPGPLRLVEKGVLKTFLLTRQPLRGFEGSNGRARMPGGFGAATAGFGNLFVSATETSPVSELKKRLIEMCRARNKPYGIIVRQMDFPSSASIDEVRRILSGSQSGGSRPVSAPLLVYKLFPDGREELVRGVRFRGLSVRSLKDILAAGDDSVTFEFLDNPAPFALMGAGGFVSETSVVAPSILVDDLELRPVDDEAPKAPVAPAPEMAR